MITHILNYITTLKNSENIMDKDYQSHKFEFFKTSTKQKFISRDSAFITASFCIFMSSFILPVAYFQNYKNSHIVSTGANKRATVMKCEDKNSEIYCHIEETIFQHKD